MTAPAEFDQGELPEGYEASGAFRVTSPDKAAWVVNKLLGYDEQLARLDSQYQTMRRRLLAQRESFEGMFLQPLRQWAELNPPAKGKTIHLLTGSLSFRRVKAGTKVVDAKAAVKWAEEHFPEAVCVTVQKRPYVEALRAHFEDTGEIPPGVVFEEEREEFYVRAPKPETEEF